MNTDRNSQPFGHRPPWDGDSTTFFEEIGQRVACDALVVGVIDVRGPRPDELLAARGWPDEQLVRWCEGEAMADPLLREAMQHGAAACGPGAGPARSPLLSDGYGMFAMLPESMADGRWWWLAMRRDGRAYGDNERRLAALLLRRWQVAFNQGEEPAMGRLLVGEDDRLLMADLDTQTRVLENPTMIQTLLAELRPVIQQRYPHLDDHQTRDVALSIGDADHWIRFSRRHTLGNGQPCHWLLELRPLGDDELPPVGVVGDKRVAQAIVYLHDNYSTSPSLSDVARQVHMSPFHFHRLFTRHTGISPKQYLQRKQLQVAKWLLRTSRTPIGQIASATGFSSHGHFTSTFHRLIGISPSTYRQRG